jgi:WD40 repeat protein
VLAFAANAPVIASQGVDGWARVWDIPSGKLLHQFQTKAAVFRPIALSADGKLLATGERANQVIRLWDLSGPKPREAPWPGTGHRGGRLTVAFAPDGRSLLTASQDPSHTSPVRDWASWSLRRWTPAGKQLAAVESGPGGQVHFTAFSPDARRLAVATHDGMIHLWDAEGGKKLRGCLGTRRVITFKAGNVVTAKYFQIAFNDPVFSADGKVLLATEKGTVLRWDVETGKAMESFESWEKGNRKPPADSITRMQCFTSPDEDTLLLASWSSFKTRLVLVGAHDGLYRREFPTLNGWAWVAAFSPDGGTLAVPEERTSPGVVRLFEVSSGAERGRLSGAPQLLRALAFSPDGRLLAAAGSRREEEVRVWHLASGRELFRFQGGRHSVTSLAFSPDSRLLATAGYDNTALLWDVVKGAPPLSQLSRADLDIFHNHLSNLDGEQAYQAIWKLAAAPKQSVPALRGWLKPSTRPDAKHIARLIAQLDEDAFEKREQARVALEKLAEHAEPALRQALADKPSTELRRQAERLLKHLADERERRPAALTVALRMLEALELIGTAETLSALGELARAANDDPVGRAARRALKRLEARPTKP